MPDGSHVRHHTKPRLSLFTPAKIKNSPHAVDSRRTTVGVRRDGSTFVVMDDWHDQGDAHRQLEQEWTGYTVFHSAVANEELRP